MSEPRHDESAEVGAGPRGGYIKAWRVFRDHWLYKSPEPFCPRSAWIDLIWMANHAPGRFLCDGRLVRVPRGQIVTSQKALAECWRWSRGKVRRYLQQLESDHMIVQQTDNKKTTITITNYDKYQGGKGGERPADDTANGPPTDNRRTSDGHKQEEYKKGEEVEGENTPAPSTEKPKRKRRSPAPVMIGEEPREGADSLPEKLQAAFREQGKEEAYPNVWLSESEYQRLVAKFGQDRVDAGGKLLTEWSLSLNLSKKPPHEPGWKSYRLLRDHAMALANQIQMQARWGKVWLQHGPSGPGFYFPTEAQ